MFSLVIRVTEVVDVFGSVDRCFARTASPAPCNDENRPEQIDAGVR